MLEPLVVTKDASGWRVDAEGVYLCPECQEEDEQETWLRVDPEVGEEDEGVTCEGCGLVLGGPPEWLLRARYEQAVDELIVNIHAGSPYTTGDVLEARRDLFRGGCGWWTEDWEVDYEPPV